MGVAAYKRQLVEGIDCKISVVITPPHTISIPNPKFINN